jgi:hypothetical protein
VAIYFHELRQGHNTGEAFWKNEGPGRLGHSPTKAKPSLNVIALGLRLAICSGSAVASG